MALDPIILERKLDSRLWGGDTLGGWLGLAQEYGADQVGARNYARGGADFPLLAKFIDAADHLSIQVHPDDAYAHTVEAASGFHGKTEAWYILHAEPGADLIHGLSAPTNRDAFAAALRDGSLMSLMRRVPAVAGTTVFVPAGTIHAINAGIMLFEIQQKSDLTYRVYDYDRRDAQGHLRELHVDRALDVSNFGEQPPAVIDPRPIDDVRTLLVTCAYFTMERWEVALPFGTSVDPGSFDILTVIDGATELAWEGGARRIARGESLVLPASLGAYRLTPADKATLLRCYVP
jgi:mannose-6-phosphate isomerase